MSELGALTVKISADTTELKGALKDADNQIKKTGDSLDANLSAGLKTLAIASAAAVAGLGYFVKQTMDAIGTTTDLAYRLNTSIASLQAFQRAAQLTGIEDTSGLLTIFNRQLSEAATTAEGPAAEALKRLNLTAAQLLELPIDQRVQLLGERMVALVPAGQQAAMATAFFGRSAQAMLEILRDSGSIQSAKKELEDLGVALSDIDAEKVNEAGDAMTTFGLAVQGAATQLTLAMAPVIYKISQDFAQAARETGGFKSVMEGVALTSYMVYEGLSNVAKGLGMVVLQGAIAAQQIEEFLFSANNTDSITKLRTTIDDMWKSMDGSMAVESFKLAQEELAKIAQQAAEKKDIGNTDVGAVGLTEAQKKALDDKINALREATMQEIELENYKYQENAKLLLEALEAKRITMEEYNKIFFDMDLKHIQSITDLNRKAALDRIAIAERESRDVNAMRTQSVNLAVGLLQTLGQKSKAAALAAILLNRGLAIATTIQNTAVAQMRALAELGPIAGAAAAGTIGAYGAAQIGLIAATGLLEAGGALSGGGDIGSGGNTVGTATSSINANQTALTSNTGAVPNNAVVQITLVGDNYGKEQVRNLITAINDAVADGSTLRLT
jgi:hypothetical protein